MLEAWLWAFFALVVVFGFVVFRGAPYVPTRRRDLDLAFTRLYPLGENDLLVDIGSGDGVVLRAAAAKGARALGYELNPLLVVISRLASRRHGGRVEVRLADFWRATFPPETTVVYTFGDSRDIGKMHAKVQREAARLARPIYFISYGFAVPGEKPARAEGAYYLYLVEPS